MVDHTILERDIVMELGPKHPFIVDFDGSFQSEKCLYLVIELLPCMYYFRALLISMILCP